MTLNALAGGNRFDRLAIAAQNLKHAGRSVSCK